MPFKNLPNFINFVVGTTLFKGRLIIDTKMQYQNSSAESASVTHRLRGRGILRMQSLYRVDTTVVTECLKEKMTNVTYCKIILLKK